MFNSTYYKYLSNILYVSTLQILPGVYIFEKRVVFCGRMGTSVPRALTASILVLGVFLTPFAHVVHGEEEVASTTPTQTESDTASSTTPTEPTTFEVTSDQSTTTPDPLPTGVLFDNSYADTEWNVNGYGGGHIIYAFPDSGTWTTPNTVMYARVQKPIDTPCSIFYVAGVTGMIVFSRTTLLPSFYNDHSVESTDHKFCDFYFGAGGIPPQTPIEGFILSGASLTVPGSSKNAGTSLNGSGQDPIPGGFAFQLCGVDGCSGGFGSSTPPGPKVSNVLFLPGIKGSRLYEDTNACGDQQAPCSLKLWEPYGDVVAKDLLQDFEGKSKEEVYVKEGDVMDEVAGQKFYKSFLEDLHAKDVSDEYGSAWQWRAIAYDWRLSLPDIVNHGAKYGDKIYYDQATSTPYIEQTLRELARTSATGKVTIIAHSNGGLVTKALLQKIGAAETANLVDKIIFVGVPQSGAPQALGALLFGYGESLPGKFYLPDVLISKQLSRQMAENSPMAYHLMPSQRYLYDAQDPRHSIIGFSAVHMYQAERDTYGPSIDSMDELDRYLLAREDGREKPEYSDLTIANILNPNLISYANTTHDSLDTWIPPEGVELYQLAGWGVDTVSGIDFYDEQKILGRTIGYKKQYRPIFVEDGDGVVPVPSALMTSSASNVHDLWINFQAIEEQLTKNYDHGNMFESESVISFIEKELTSSSIEIPFISNVQPSNKEPRKKLIFQLHSPLTLGIYDSQGSYTGLNKDGSISTQVLGTTYGEFGDVKYIIAPAGFQYELVMQGLSEGTFSLDIEERDATNTTMTTIADVPTTSGTTARFKITNGITDASPLLVDYDGNGIEDIQLTPVAGESIQYTPPLINSDGEISRAHKGSSNTLATSLNAETSHILPQTKTSISETDTKSRDHKNKVASARNSSSLSTSSQSDVFNSKTQTLTASAHDAFVPFTKWFMTLMYNIWKNLLSWLSVL